MKLLVTADLQLDAHPFAGANLVLTRAGHRDCIACRRRRYALSLEAA